MKSIINNMLIYFFSKISYSWSSHHFGKFSRFSHLEDKYIPAYFESFDSELKSRSASQRGSGIGTIRDVTGKISVLIFSMLEISQFKKGILHDAPITVLYFLSALCQSRINLTRVFMVFEVGHLIFIRIFLPSLSKLTPYNYHIFVGQSKDRLN